MLRMALRRLFSLVLVVCLVLTFTDGGTVSWLQERLKRTDDKTPPGDTSEYCNVTIENTSGWFASPPPRYDNNLYCTYTIITEEPVLLEFTFTKFDIESGSNCKYDALSMGGDRLCGSTPQNRSYISSGTFVIVFTTDSSVTNEGFNMSFTSGPAPEGVPSDPKNCRYTAPGNNGIIQSYPGSGANYPNNLDCRYIFNVPSDSILFLNFSVFELERGYGDRCYDYIKINSGREFCGKNIEVDRVDATGEVILYFHTDSSVAARGFVAEYNIAEVPDCNVNTQELQGQYTLPTLPNGKYMTDLECNVALESVAEPHIVTVNFTYFDVEPQFSCLFDYLEVKTGDTTVDRLCGNLGSFVKQYNTSEPVLRMTFVSDYRDTSRGFSFTYTTELGNSGTTEMYLPDFLFS